MEQPKSFVALCPKCSAKLPLQQQHLEAADGYIQCGNCQEVFYAPSHLLKGFWKSKKQQDAPVESAEYAGQRFDDKLQFSYAAANEQKPEEPLLNLQPAAAQPKGSIDNATEFENSPTPTSSSRHPKPTSTFTIDPQDRQQHQSLHMGESPIVANNPAQEYTDDEQVVADLAQTTAKNLKGRSRFDFRSSKKNSTPSSPINTHKKFSKIPFIISGVALVVLLLIQGMLATRVTYASVAAYRHSYEILCTIIQCELPLFIDKETLHIDEFITSQDGNLLTIQWQLRNDAAFAQTLPLLFLKIAADETPKLIVPQQYAESLPEKVVAGNSTLPLSVTLELLTIDQLNNIEVSFLMYEPIGYGGELEEH